MTQENVFYSIEIEDIDNGFFKSYIFEDYSLAFNHFIKQINEEIKSQDGNCGDMIILQDKDDNCEDVLIFQNKDRGLYIYLREKSILNSLPIIEF